MRGFSLLVKPAGDDCNLSCPYCFYRGCGTGGEKRRMSLETLKHVLSTYRALPIPAHDVAFQGGEPLLMGEDFFRRTAEWGEGISFSVQTNGTLATPSLAKFFRENDWLVGVSPHTSACEAAFKRLLAAGVKVNLLQLITCENVGEPERIYRHLRDDLGATFQQYIECTAPAPYAITGEAWGEFLCRLFDLWYSSGDSSRVSIRLFDSIVSQLVNGYPTMCNFSRDCRNYLVIESNGNVYPCDFHVQPEFCLGNVLTDSWETLIESPKYRSFGERKRMFPDCPRNKGMLDAGWRRFFEHALPRLRELVAERMG